MSRGEKLPFVPMSLGESLHKNLAPNATSTQFLAPGRWTLSPRSTVPYAKVDIPRLGGRPVTWGHTIEVPEDNQGVVVNASAHTGDVVLDAVGTGLAFAGMPPATVTIPARFVAQNVGFTLWRSTLVDTRRARAAYLWMDLSQLVANGTQLNLTIAYQARERGAAFSPGSQAATTGTLIYQYTTNGPSGNGFPLGFGSGQLREVAPGNNNLAELRAMALLDSLYVEIDSLVPGNPGFSNVIDSFITLEYL